MAESFRWPIDDSEVEALDLESGTITRGADTLPAPAVKDDGWFPSETDDDNRLTTEAEIQPEPSAVAPAQAPTIFASISAPAPQDASPARLTDRTPITRWAVPLLLLVVAIESGWLLRDLLGAPPAPIQVVSPPIASPTGPTSPALPESPTAALTASRSDSAPAPAGATSGADNVGASASVEPGTVSIPLPFQVQVYEGARFIGINEGSLALSPGTHQLQLVNDSMGVRLSERVVITSGKTTPLAVSLPSVRMQLNAVPWADVTIDGTAVGETPLGNVPVSIGPHTLVFRHPQLGEQTRTVVVTTQSPPRISVDLRK